MLTLLRYLVKLALLVSHRVTVRSFGLAKMTRIDVLMDLKGLRVKNLCSLYGWGFKEWGFALKISEEPAVKMKCCVLLPG